jgi:DNA-binding response OmpR family regulator
MPKMNGTVTALGVKELYPDAFILYMSGNIDDIDLGQKGLLANVDFLGKPFSSSMLKSKVREILDSNPFR